MDAGSYWSIKLLSNC